MINTITSRAINVAIACAMIGGQCGCAHMSDQLMDVQIGGPGAIVLLPIAVTSAAIAPVVDSAIDERRLKKATGKKWYERKTTEDYLRVALTCENPSIRGLAVVRIAGSEDVATDSVFEGLETVACKDNSSNVRWAAIRGLSRIHDPRPVGVVLRILDQQRDMESVRPPDVRVRWGCLLLLDDSCTRGLVRNAQFDAVREVMIRHLNHPYHHDIRFAAAKGLRHFNDEASRIALAPVLKDGHVGVELRARQSLQALTGKEHTGGNRRTAFVSSTHEPGYTDRLGQTKERVDAHALSRGPMLGLMDDRSFEYGLLEKRLDRKEELK